MTLYRLYCQDCGDDTVVRESELDATEWAVESLHFHEGRCPECRDVVAPEPKTAGENATLTAFGGAD